LARSKPRPYDTVDALIEAMQSEAEMTADGDDGALTTGELEQRMNTSHYNVMRMLHALQVQGKLEVVKVYRVMIDGTRRRVAAYRVSK